MPNNFDFSYIKDIKVIEVNPEGWIFPLYVEYGFVTNPNINNGIPTCCWRVKETLHTFIIPIARLDFLSSGDYKKHFKDVLEAFRKDYIKWKEEGFTTEWSREYAQQYSRFIIV